MSLLKENVALLVAQGGVTEALELTQAAVAVNAQSAEAWGILSHTFELARDLSQGLHTDALHLTSLPSDYFLRHALMERK